MGKTPKYSDLVRKLAYDYIRNLQKMGTLKPELREKEEDRIVEDFVDMKEGLGEKALHSLLTIRTGFGVTLGMEAAKQKCEKVVLLVLDDEEASLMQDSNGWNVGRYALENHLPEATYKAILNKKIANAADKYGRTMCDRTQALVSSFDCDENLKADIIYSSIKYKFNKARYQHEKRENVKQNDIEENVIVENDDSQQGPYEQ